MCDLFIIAFLVFCLGYAFIYKKHDAEVERLKSVIREDSIKYRADSIAHEKRLHNCWAEVGK